MNRIRKRRSLSVCLWVEYEGLPDERDDQISKLVGRHQSGSGYCFVYGTRDLNFEFATIRGAQGASKRVKSALGRKVKVSIQ
jgi:hypothetical protein